MTKTKIRFMMDKSI